MSGLMSLLNLPGEIRNQIYQESLNSILLQPEHVAWDTFPSHARFRDYLNLLLTCRQISSELSYLIQQPRFFHKLCFYFEDATDLYAFQQRTVRHHWLAKVTIVLRASRSCPQRERYVAESIEELIEAQPGFDRFILPFDESTMDGMVPIFDEWPDQQDWNSELASKGCCIETIPCDQDQHSPEYYACSFPLVEGMQVKIYSWQHPFEPLQGDHLDELSCIVMQHQLADVKFDKFDLHAARFHSAYQDGTEYQLIFGQEPRFDQIVLSLWRNSLEAAHSLHFLPGIRWHHSCKLWLHDMLPGDPVCSAIERPGGLFIDCEEHQYSCAVAKPRSGLSPSQGIACEEHADWCSVFLLSLYPWHLLAFAVLQAAIGNWL